MPRRKKAPPHGWIDRNTGQLYAVLNYTEDGKKKQKYQKAQDRDHVLQLHAEMVAKLKTEGPEALDNHKKTFADLVRHYKQVHVKTAVFVDGRKVSGFRRKIKDVEHEIQVCADWFGAQSLRSIHFEDIEEFRAYLYSTTTKRGTAPAVSTVNHYLKRLRRMLNVAERKGWITKNPCAGERTLITATQETERTRRLAKGEEAAILENCKDSREYMRGIILAAIDTGMRQGEILKLRKTDVDFDKNLIHVSGLEGGTKDMRSRLVPLSARLKAELMALCQTVEGERVFPYVSILKAFRAICDKADVKGLTFHDLRHEATFRILDACQGNYIQAMRITGHGQIKTFLRYVNVDAENIQKVVERMSQ